MGKKQCGIYKITSPTGSIYIGQSADIKQRFYRYYSLACIDQPRIYNSLKKHGPENHVFEIIKECDELELDKWEVHYIDFYKTFDTELGMNLQGGGGRKTHSEESKRKISDSNKGKQNMLGKKHSEEAKRKIGLSRASVVYSEETRMKISNSRKGQPAWNKGKKSTVPFKERPRDSRGVFLKSK